MYVEQIMITLVCVKKNNLLIMVDCWELSCQISIEELEYTQCFVIVKCQLWYFFHLQTVFISLSTTIISKRVTSIRSTIICNFKRITSTWNPNFFCMLESCQIRTEFGVYLLISFWRGYSTLTIRGYLIIFYTMNLNYICGFFQ